MTGCRGGWGRRCGRPAGAFGSRGTGSCARSFLTGRRWRKSGGRENHSHIPAVRHYARMTVENADIQIALRGMASGWEMERFRQALAAAGELDPERMARAAAAGSRALETYLENVGFGEAAEAFGESGAGLERWQRERERRLIGQARRDVFSGGLILAYFLQRSREIRLVREMLVEKRGEGSEGGERMRA